MRVLLVSTLAQLIHVLRQTLSELSMWWSPTLVPPAEGKPGWDVSGENETDHVTIAVLSFHPAHRKRLER